MKVQHFILALASVAMLATSCEEKQIFPGNNDHNKPDLNIDEILIKPEEGTQQISVTKSAEIAVSLENMAVTSEVYQIRGIVSSLTDKKEGIDTQWGNATFKMTDNRKELICYRTKGLNGSGFTDVNQLAIGDTIVVIGHIQNYNGKPELKDGNVVKSSNPNLK